MVHLAMFDKLITDYLEQSKITNTTTGELALAIFGSGHRLSAKDPRIGACLQKLGWWKVRPRTKNVQTRTRRYYAPGYHPWDAPSNPT